MEKQQINFPKYVPGNVILSKANNLYVVKEVHIVLHERGTSYRYYIDSAKFLAEPDIKGLVKVELPND